MRLLTGLTADLGHAMPLAGAATDFGSGRAGPADTSPGKRIFRGPGAARRRRFP
jgi:hypothetical protein